MEYFYKSKHRYINERVKREMNDRIIDTCKVWTATLLASLTWGNVNGFLTTISLSIAICYTVWKWRRDKKKVKK